MSRWFVAQRLGSVDQEGGFRCQRERLLDYDEGMGLQHSSYRFTNMRRAESYVGIGAYETTWKDIKKIDGWGYVDIVIGGGYIWNLQHLLEQKLFFNFSGSDLEFFKYLGSGMASSLSEVGMPLCGRAIYNIRLGDLPGVTEAGLPETRWGPVLCVCAGRDVVRKHST